MSGNKSISRAPVDLESEADAYAFLERLRWGIDGPDICPHCGSDKGAWYLKPKNPEGRKSKGGSTARSQRRVWKCRENSCRRQFSVLTNTVLHATKMPVRAWVGAVSDLCNDPAGISARDIAARWGVTEKSAWAMLNRIQEALATPEVAGASLHLNAPLWFELSAAEMASLDEEQQHQELAAAADEAEHNRAEQQKNARIKHDVQRALKDVLPAAATALDGTSERDVEARLGSLEADRGRELGAGLEPAAADEGRDFGTDLEPVQAHEGRGLGADPESAGAAQGRELGAGLRPDLASVEADEARELGAGLEPVEADEGRELGAGLESAEAGQGRDFGTDLASAHGSKIQPSEVKKQVESDVQRALAEAFGDALPPSLATPNGAESAASEPRMSPEVDAAATAEPVERQAQFASERPKDRVDTAAPQASKSDTDPPKKLGKAARKKRKKRARAAANAAAKQRAAKTPQPVDNSDIQAAAAPPDQQVQEQEPVPLAAARQEEIRDDRATSTAGQSPQDSLGRGWLDSSPQPSADQTHTVSSAQGQLHGIETGPVPELGPAWASTKDDMYHDTPQNSGTSDDQLHLFEELSEDGE